MTAFEFTYSGAFLTEGLQRSRSAKKSTIYFAALKWVLGIILCALAALCIRLRAYGSGGVLLLFVILLVASRRLDVWSLRRRFRKSPHYNERFHVEISGDGLSNVGKNIRGQAAWAVYTMARRFDDGFLLRQGPGQFNWLPFDAMVAGTIEEADALIRANIADYRQISKHPETDGTLV